MARARNIKPAFFKNEALAELPFEHRLLFIGLWTLADRVGKLEDRPKRIKMEVFPADNVSVDAALNELAAHGFIDRYEAQGIKVLRITNFLKHQSPHPREKDSALPDPAAAIHLQDTGLSDAQKHLAVSKQDEKAAQGAGFQRCKQKPCTGMGRSASGPSDLLNPDVMNPESENPDVLNAHGCDLVVQNLKNKKMVQYALPKDFSLTSASSAYAQKLGIDVELELQTFCNYHIAKGSFMLDWQAAWRAWCNNAVRFGKASAVQVNTKAAATVFKQSAIEQKNKATLERLLKQGVPDEHMDKKGHGDDT